MPNIDPEVFAERLQTYRNALARLEEALALPKDAGKAYLDASAHRFILCYELTWKNLRRLLRMREVKVNSPVLTFREAYHEGWIEEKPLYEQMIEDRNAVTHEYFEAQAVEIYGRLPRYVEAMKKLAERMQAIYAAEPKGL